MALNQFLKNSNIIDYTTEAMRSDCSPRKYYRVYDKKARYILMDSSAELFSLKPFINIANTLLEIGLVAPKIYSQNLEKGYLLLEDFGDELFSAYINANPNLSAEFYIAAMDVLIQISQFQINKNIPIYSYELLNKELYVFIEWFLNHKLSCAEAEAASQELVTIFNALYGALSMLPSVLVLRDYHADNIMIVNDKLPKADSLGLLDFQDAVLGNPAYDVVSFLQDARVDVSCDTEKRCIKHFLDKTGYDERQFHDAYHILGLQRNLKIVGIFHRKNIRDNSPSYLSFLPRVWKYIEKSLHALGNEQLIDWFKKYNIFSYADN